MVVLSTAINGQVFFVFTILQVKTGKTPIPFSLSHLGQIELKSFLKEINGINYNKATMILLSNSKNIRKHNF